MAIIPLRSEQDARQIIENLLANAGWAADAIAREVPKYDEQKKALGNLRPDWLLYSADSRVPVAVVEAKKPQKNQKNLLAALEQGANYAKKLACPLVFSCDGDVVMTRHMSNGAALFIGDREVSTILSPLQMQKFLQSNVWHRGQSFSESGALVKLFNSAKRALNREGIAKMDAFNEFAKLLFVKILTELHDSGDAMFGGIPARWDDFANRAGHGLLEAYSAVLTKLDAEYHGGFSQSQMRLPATLEKLVGLVTPHSFIDTEEDVKGRAYEYFLRDYTKDKDELNRYFTPRHIVEAMVKMVRVRPGEKVYDPFCGTGGMLIESFRQARRLLSPLGTAGRKKEIDNLRHNCFFGGDISDAAYIAKMNMVLSGDGHSNIERGDSLSHESRMKHRGKYNIVLTNIPFSQRHEAAYINHCLDSIRGRVGSRAAIIVPERVINEHGYDSLRRGMLAEFYLERVVSLPKDVFAEYTNAKTCVLVLSFRATHKRQETFDFFAITSDGHEGKTRRRPSFEAMNDLADMISGKLLPTKINLRDNHFLFSPNEKLIVKAKNNYKMVKMGEVIKLAPRPFSITPGIVCLEPGFVAKDHTIFINKRKSFSEVAASGRTRSLIKKGDLVVSMMHTQNGLVALYDGEDDLHATSTHRAFTINESLADRRYIFWTLRELVMKLKKDDTTGRENYRPHDILELDLPLPPLPKQREIAVAMDQARQKIRDAEQSLKTVEKNFQISGEKYLPFKLTKIRT